MAEEKIYDCIIIGAGPGGLQAAIYLGRYNCDVLLIDKGGGRTWHAKHIENFLSHRSVSGEALIKKGMEQAMSFNVRIEKDLVMKVLKNVFFEIHTKDKKYISKFVIVSSGVYDHFPPIENLHRFLGSSLFTCIDCDGYKTTARKLVIIGNSPKSATLALAMKEMFTKDITLILYADRLPPEYREELEEENIPLIVGRPIRIIGDEKAEAIEMKDGKRVECEAIMSHFGYKLNDEFLSDLKLKRDADGFKYVVNHHYESSLSGLFIVGPLNTGYDQAIIAAGEGAVAAISLKSGLLEL